MVRADISDIGDMTYQRHQHRLRQVESCGDPISESTISEMMIYTVIGNDRFVLMNRFAALVLTSRHRATPRSAVKSAERGVCSDCMVLVDAQLSLFSLNPST